MRLVSKVLKVAHPYRTRHYFGFPKELASEESNSQEMMKAPDILLIEKRDEGFFLFRFTADGIPVGDTWHLNLEDAKHQAEFEFDCLIFSWGEIPPDVTDVVSFALEKYLGAGQAIFQKVLSSDTAGVSNLYLVVHESEKTPIGIADEKFLDYLNACGRLRTGRDKVELLVELWLFFNTLLS